MMLGHGHSCDGAIASADRKAHSRLILQTDQDFKETPGIGGRAIRFRLMSWRQCRCYEGHHNCKASARNAHSLSS